MKIQSVNTSQSFGMLKRDATMTKAMFNVISDAPAVKKFGEKYDATLSVGTFLSSKTPNKVQYSLRFEDIKPKSFVEKVKNMFSKKVTNEVRLKTHATNENDFIDHISEQRSNAVLNIYNK